MMMAMTTIMVYLAAKYVVVYIAICCVSPCPQTVNTANLYVTNVFLLLTVSNRLGLCCDYRPECFPSCRFHRDQNKYLLNYLRIKVTPC